MSETHGEKLYGVGEEIGGSAAVSLACEVRVPGRQTGK